MHPDLIAEDARRRLAERLQNAEYERQHARRTQRRTAAARSLLRRLIRPEGSRRP